MLKVDFGQEKGAIRRINGVNLAPRLYGSENVDMNSSSVFLIKGINRVG